MATMGLRFPGFRIVAAAWLLAAGMGAAHADKMADMRDSVESSMSIKGTIDVDAEGRVTGYKVKDAEAYPKGILGLLAASVPAWRFEPAMADGHAVPATADMFLLVVAHRTGEDRYDIGIRKASFTGGQPGTRVGGARMSPPAYPESMNHARVGGTVFLLLRVDRNGKVGDVFAEQTNLGILGRPREMDAMRASFERSATLAAKHWTFAPPTTGPSAGDPDWVVRVPVVFVPNGASQGPGRWQTYVPGPHRVAPWARNDALAETGIDALEPGGVYQVGQGLRLLTPLGAG
jgi:hypothetical protein